MGKLLNQYYQTETFLGRKLLNYWKMAPKFGVYWAPVAGVAAVWALTDGDSGALPFMKETVFGKKEEDK